MDCGVFHIGVRKPSRLRGERAMAIDGGRMSGEGPHDVQCRDIGNTFRQDMGYTFRAWMPTDCDRGHGHALGVLLIEAGTVGHGA